MEQRQIESEQPYRHTVVINGGNKNSEIIMIPAEPTFGDIITAVIPIEDIWRTYSPVHGKQVCVRFKHTEDVTCFEESYWDAPYRRYIDGL